MSGRNHHCLIKMFYDEYLMLCMSISCENNCSPHKIEEKMSFLCVTLYVFILSVHIKKKKKLFVHFSPSWEVCEDSQSSQSWCFL